MKNDILRIHQLVKELNQHCYNYYTLDNPTISDKEYDKLYDELIKLEKETSIILSNSPTQRVGYEILDKLEKTKHEYPLLSLDKTKDIDELIKFSNNKDMVLMLKLDGLTTDLLYEDGKLIQATTRGNGIEGEIITHNVKTFENVPLTIPHKERIHISGESIITYDVFNKINSKLPENEKYKNPRNLAAGSLRQLNSGTCKQRKLRFIGYNVNGKEFKSKIQQLEFISKQGFEIVNNYIVKNDEETLHLKIDYLKTLSINIPIDGMVLTFNDLEYGESLGKTSHHYNHSLALKFYDEEVETTLRKVDFQVGRTGILTPIAIFDTVEIDGTDVNKASLHNLTIMQNLGLEIGSRINVIKANQIIPQVTKCVSKGTDTIKIPFTCPVCDGDTKIIQENNTKMLYCTNPNCKAKLIQRLVHYCSRDAINIEGLSEKTLEKFIEKGFIKDILDIYKLPQYKDEILKMEGFKIKSYNNLINSIEKSKTCKLAQFIFALGMPNVGKSTAKDVCSHFNNDLNIIKEVKDFTCVKDIGDITNNSLINWFINKENTNLLSELNNILVFKTEEVQTEIKNNILQGKSYYLTGTFEYGKKKELKELVESNGGIFADKFNKQIDGLVIGKLKGSSKDKKAELWKIKVYPEDEFLKLVHII